jgi:hypothetical protein
MPGVMPSLTNKIDRQLAAVPVLYRLAKERDH